MIISDEGEVEVKSQMTEEDIKTIEDEMIEEAELRYMVDP